MTLTKRQHEVLEYIRHFQRNHQISPTLDEIAEALTVSKVTIFEHIQALARKGYIRKTRNHSRSIELIENEESSTGGLSILGSVAAGLPIEPIATPEAFSFDDMVPPDRDCYILKVQGNSMIDEQIRDGDYVLVEKRDTALNGETVVAIVDGEGATLKRFYREKNRIRLQPANPDMEPIYTRNADIQGIVVGVIRRYQ